MSRPASASPTGPGAEVVALGAPAQIVGFDLVGVRALPARDDDEVRAAWRGLPATVVVVVLTPAAAVAVAAERRAAGAPLTVVLPP